jgi:uncharacterized membrane protein
MSDPNVLPPASPTPRSEARRPRRWLGPALFLSVALNLLAVGILAGAVLGQRGDAGGRMPGDAAALSWFAALDAQDRAALRAAWRREGPALQSLRAQRRAETAALAAALRADPFDPAALEAALAAQAAGLAERQALAQRLLVERLAAMDPAGRAAFADRLEAGPQHHTARPERHDREGRPDRMRD